jgi:hypothetical protein
MLRQYRFLDRQGLKSDEQAKKILVWAILMLRSNKTPQKT